jgi:hypothetical protein
LSTELVTGMVESDIVMWFWKSSVVWFVCCVCVKRFVEKR